MPLHLVLRPVFLFTQDNLPQYYVAKKDRNFIEESRYMISLISTEKEPGVIASIMASIIFRFFSASRICAGVICIDTK